jgi:VanZ family protein
VLLSGYVLFWPDPAGPDSGVPGADKVVHAVLFALLAATARLRLGARRWVLAAVLGYAVLSEVVQAVALPDRSGDGLDVVADVAGALAAWALLSRRAGRPAAPEGSRPRAAGPPPRS